MPLVSGSLLSHYEIRSKIGSGGMGEVYLAHDTNLGRNGALKILPDNLAQDPHRMQRFIQEARAASAINHPNVCTIHEVGQSDDGRSFIAMEYIEGETLADKIQGSPLPSFEIVDLGSQIASALEGAHAKGIIHRDIKPRNIAVTPRGQAKVLDFGLAHVMPQQKHVPIQEASTLARTETGILLGTIDYMSPEQALGREIDTRTDIFSLGVVLYEIATGRKPFSTENKLETIDRIAHLEPDPPSQLNKRIPSELQRIITKCLQKNPQRRYQSARDLVSDFQALKHEAHPRLYGRLTAALAVVSLALLLLWIPSVRQQVLRWSGLARLPEKKFLAVLPFRVIGDDPASQTFADGLMEILQAGSRSWNSFTELFPLARGGSPRAWHKQRRQSTGGIRSDARSLRERSATGRPSAVDTEPQRRTNAETALVVRERVRINQCFGIAGWRRSGAGKDAGTGDTTEDEAAPCQKAYDSSRKLTTSILRLAPTCCVLKT